MATNANGQGERHIHPIYNADPALYVFKRPASRFYYAETCIHGRKLRKSLRPKTDRLTTAFALAADWLKDLHRATLAEDKKRKYDKLSSDPTIGELFHSWRTTLTPSRRDYHDEKWAVVGVFWKAIRVTDVTPQLFRDYFSRRRREQTHYKKPPTNNTLSKDVTLLRLIFSYAIEEGHLETVPTIPRPGEVVPNPRPWLTRHEWDHLYQVSQKRVEEAEALHNSRLVEQRVELDDQMTWMVSTMQRVGEMLALRFRDCHVKKNSEGDEILICEIPSDTKQGARTNIGRRAVAMIRFGGRVD